MKPLHLFNAYGVELEYMIVDQTSLEVKSISDSLLIDEAGHLTGDVRRGDITWSNELVLHVVELKSTRPTQNLDTLQKRLHGEIIRINDLLKKYNSMLMPTAMHPFMDPFTQVKLWPHDFAEVYHVYDKLFNCRGHGWSNVQSTHLNLPFTGDVEFANLHSAIRVILPLLPALCGSSPIVDGKITGFNDSRLEYYKRNQASIPSITGRVIPEIVKSKAEYDRFIYQPIRHDLSELSGTDILDPVWVNSRGAIARFDRGSIEIRIMDVQECPMADIAIISLVTETVKHLVLSETINEYSPAFEIDRLAIILDSTIREGSCACITDMEYLSLFEVEKPVSASELWQIILNRVKKDGAVFQGFDKIVEQIVSKGTLGERILKRLGKNYSHKELTTVYRDLSACLVHNKMYWD